MTRGLPFELVPFSRHRGDEAAPALDLSIHGHVNFDHVNNGDGRLQIVYELSGDGLSRVIWPQQSDAPQRRDNLWQHSCFECFIAERHQADYLEFNFSPNSDWAMYHFQSYRAAMTRPELDDSDVNIRFDAEADHVQCSVLVNLSKVRIKKPADLGLSCVIETQRYQYYFALTHLADQPDFHQRRSFTLLAE